MFFNKKNPSQQSGDDAPASHSGSSLFAPSLNPRPSRLNLSALASSSGVFETDTAALPTDGFHTVSETLVNSGTFAPAWLDTVATPEMPAELPPMSWSGASETPTAPSWNSGTEPSNNFELPLTEANPWSPTTEAALGSWTTTTETPMEASASSVWDISEPAAPAPVDSWNMTLPTEPESGPPAFTAGAFSWEQTPAELNEPSPEPLGLEVSMPWSAADVPGIPTWQPNSDVSFQPEEFNFDLPAEPTASAPGVVPENAPTTFPSWEIPETNMAPGSEHFLDNVHAQYYPTDALAPAPASSWDTPTQQQALQSFYDAPPAAPASQPPASPPDAWSEGASEFDEAAKYLFPETADLTAGAQNWYEQSASSLTDSNSPGAIFWPDEVLSQEVTDLGNSVQDQGQGFEDLTQAPSEFTGYSAPTLPEVDFPAQPMLQQERGLNPVLSPQPEEVSFWSTPETQQASSASATSSWESPSGWDSPNSNSWGGEPIADLSAETSLENTAWLFPATPETEPTFTPKTEEI
jgi:hypothetical protein